MLHILQVTVYLSTTAVLMSVLYEKSKTYVSQFHLSFMPPVVQEENIWVYVAQVVFFSCMSFLSTS